MDFKVDWTPTAISDLEAAVRYIAQDNLDAARALGGDLLLAADRLSSLPRQGRMYLPSSEHGEIREIHCRGYRIFYRVKEAQAAVEIVRVWHEARSEPDFGE